MASADRIGIIRIEIEGYWDVGDLLALAESLSESYGLFYPLVALDDTVRDALHDQLRKVFWSGDIESRRIGAHLYRQIPTGESLKLRSFSYASPGNVEIVGVLGCIWMLSRVARGWIKAGSEFIDLWEKVDKFFEKRKNLRRPRKTIELSDDMVISSDEARALCFTVGEKLGFDAISCDALIGIIGNPISALKYLVTAGNEGRKLATLQQGGLLKLPDPADATAPITISSAKKKSRSAPTGVIVQRTRRRPQKKS
jgi:hypothetical protein